LVVAAIPLGAGIFTTTSAKSFSPPETVMLWAPAGGRHAIRPMSVTSEYCRMG